MAHHLSADVIAQEMLLPIQRRMLYELYTTYYTDCNEKLFYDDLSHKHWVLLLFDEHQAIRGFSTLFVGEHQIRYANKENRIRSVFSGDTIIHHQFWGEQTLPLAWCRFAGKLKAEHPSVPLYWFLIVKGHRTYRYLRVFSKKYYPVYSHSTPPEIKTIMDQLGHEHFGSNYHAESGLIQFNEPHGSLKKAWSGIDKHALKKPDVQFFIQQNPGYEKGDELACLTELAENNLQRYALAAFYDGLNNG